MGGKVSLILPGLIFFVVTGQVLRSAGDDESGLVYQNDFTQASTGGLAQDLLVLEGDFTVEKKDAQAYLKLSALPLLDASVQLGENLAGGAIIKTRVKAEMQGRRAPVFGVGLHGVTGFQLVVEPAGKKLKLKRGIEWVQDVKFEWRSGQWYFVELSVLENSSNWTIEGRVWAESEKRPEVAQIEYIAEEKPNKGRAYLSGTPSSGRPIYYDDIELRAVTEK